MKIVLDVGSNWETLEDCLESCRKAKTLGADAIKFQSFISEDLYGISGKVKDNIPSNFIKPIAGLCKEINIEFMCSVFTPKMVEVIDPYVQTHKIASSEAKNLELLRLTAKTGKPVYLSTGGCTYDNITVALNILGKSNTTLLYCVVDYPSRTHALSNIHTLRTKYKVDVGYSDHSMDIYEAPASAKRLGATVLEKHFKIKDFKSNDDYHALNPLQTMAMIDHLDSCSQEYKTETERANLNVIIRRPVAIKLIQKGEAFQHNVNFSMSRHQDSVLSSYKTPKYIEGKLANKIIYRGEQIRPIDVT